MSRLSYIFEINRDEREIVFVFKILVMVVVTDTEMNDYGKS